MMEEKDMLFGGIIIGLIFVVEGGCITAGIMLSKK